MFPATSMYPGMPHPGYIAPEGPFTQFMRPPMFSGGGGPNYTGPFNVSASGPMGMLLPHMERILQTIMAGTGRTPFQMFSQQNLYDQIMANQYYMGQSQAMQSTARMDAIQLAATMGGLTRMITGRDPTAVQEAQFMRMGNQLPTLLPYLTQFLGPSGVDALFGSRGSGMLMGQQIHAAMRTAVDPVTGRIGLSGASAGAISQEVYARTFGDDRMRTQLRGLTAGSAGSLVNELAMRGYLGGLDASQPFSQRIRGLGTRYRDILGMAGTGPITPEIQAQLDAAANSVMDDDAISRAAQRDPEIQRMRARGDLVGETDLQAARQRVRNTRNTVLRNPNISSEQLREMPGGEDVLRSGESGQIVNRIQNMVGAVNAMREIFGDMGHPNAPMRELINGLEQLTQGGLATMSPGTLEQVVRRVHATSQLTGIGMQGMMALSTQSAQLAVRQGLDPTFAPFLAMGSANFGRAAADTQMLNRPRWGARNIEQLTLLDQQARTNATASPQANRLAALLRMQDEGVLTPGSNPDLDNLLRRVRAGEADPSMMLTEQQAMAMLSRAGVNATTANGYFRNRFANQEALQRNGVGDIVRRLQPLEQGRRVDRAFNGALSQLGGNDVLHELRNSGYNISRDQLRGILTNASRGLGTDFLGMSAEDQSSPERERAYMEAAARRRLVESLRTSVPGMSQEAAEAAATSMLQRAGGNLGQNMMNALDMYIGRNIPTLRNRTGFWQMYNSGTMQSQRARQIEAEVTGERQSIFGGMGGMGLGQRFMDELANTTNPNRSWRDFVSNVLGGQQIPESLRNSDMGTALMDVLQMDARADTNSPGFRDAQRRNNTILRGLVQGGQSAQTALNALNALPAGAMPDAQLRRLREQLTLAQTNPSQALSNLFNQADPFRLSRGDAEFASQFNPLSGAAARGANADFDNDSNTATVEEQQAANVLDRIRGGMAPGARPRGDFDRRRREFGRDIVNRGTAGRIDRGLRARERFGQLYAQATGRNWANLSAEERSRLSDVAIEQAEAGEFGDDPATQEALRAARPFANLSRMKPSEIRDLLKRLGAGGQGGSQGGSGGGTNSSQILTVRITGGTLLLRPDGSATPQNIEMAVQNQAQNAGGGVI